MLVHLVLAVGFIVSCFVSYGIAIPKESENPF